jgi:4-hydroxy-3-methylbut-2-enyl diphosphate reductase
VVRALDTVEAALEDYGPPLYVHHEIVHNPHVVQDLRERGVVFVSSVEEVPADARLIISAHGAPRQVVERARQRKLRLVDTTCPLVTKVHREISHHAAHGRHIILIGHRDHVEVAGSRGQVRPEQVSVIESIADAEAMPVDPNRSYAYATQTTLAVGETAEIVATLTRRIPDLVGPRSTDICYATSNRQAAVSALAKRCNGIVVIGGANSSNSQRLVEAAERAGCRRTWFVSRGREADPDWFHGLETLGVASGASTPESLVEELLERLAQRFSLSFETVAVASEQERYNLPSLRPFADLVV